MNAIWIILLVLSFLVICFYLVTAIFLGFLKYHIDGKFSTTTLIPTTPTLQQHRKCLQRHDRNSDTELDSLRDS